MNRLYFYRSLITRIRQFLISKSGTNPVTLTNAVEDKLLQGFSIIGNSQQSGTPSVESPSPIQTTELKKSSNLLHTDYFNEAKTANGVTFQYLADEDCFLLNGTSTANGSIASPYSISNANNQPFTISAFYVSGNVTVPTNSDIVAYIGGSNDNFNTNNFNYTELRQNNTSRTKICNYPYITMFWFYFTAGVVLENYKVKISVTKLENIFDISKVQTTANITNNGDSLLIAPSSTATTATTAQTLSDICPELEVGDNVIANLTITNDAGVYNAFSQYKAYIYLTISKRTFVAGTKYTITQDDLNSKIIFYVSPYGSTTPTENKSTITNISISKIPTNYEPYGKYGLEIKQEWYRNVVNNVVTEDTTYKVTFTNVQLEQGTEASTYTPYQPPQYNRIWINKPFLGETDILTYDGTNLKIVKKEFKINLKDDVVWSYIEPTESGSIGTIKGIVNGSADLYRTLLSNTSQTYLCTHYNSSFFEISRKHTEGIITLRNTVLVFNGLQTDYDSFIEVINTGNVEMLIKYVNNRPADQNQFTRTITSSSYIDLKPLSAGNNTLTVTNEISPTRCYYEYYSSKEN